MDLANIRWNAFMDNLGTDWVAIDEHGNPVCRASDRATVERAVPHAALVLTGTDLEAAATPAPEGLGMDPVGFAAFDHDGDGSPGGSPAGAGSTAAKGKAKKAAAKK